MPSEEKEIVCSQDLSHEASRNIAQQAQLYSEKKMDRETTCPGQVNIRCANSR